MKYILDELNHKAKLREALVKIEDQNMYSY